MTAMATATQTMPELTTSDISRMLYDELKMLKGEDNKKFKKWIDRLDLARINDRYGDIWSGYVYSVEQVGPGQALRHFCRQDGGQNSGLKSQLIAFIKRKLRETRADVSVETAAVA